VYAGQATEEEEEEFWRTSRERPELLKGILTELEKKVTDAPRDIDARLALASAYIAKLYTVPDGPEKGVWSMKAVTQWNAVIEQDPNNWDAHQSLGFNYSFWPDQFNKGPDAIKHFEAARKIQEGSTPDAKHANTYIQLHKLYVKAGKTDEAAKVLEEGLRRFPDDEELKKLK
jgi:tetratricopeptide (TPR) repeat protein